MDKWDRKTSFNCDSCMFFVPKIEHSSPDRTIFIDATDLEFRIAKEGEKGIEIHDPQGRCRRNAPTMKGYPVVYASDWCGEHKIGSNPVRDGKEKSLTKEDVRKVLDEPLDSTCFDQPLVKTDAILAAEKEKAAGKNVVLSGAGTLVKEAEEKAEQQQRAWGKDQIFHHCGFPGNIKPYPKVLCSSCGHTKTDDDFNAFEEIKRLFYAVSGASIMNAGLIEEKAKIKAEIREHLDKLCLESSGVYVSGYEVHKNMLSILRFLKEL